MEILSVNRVEKSFKGKKVVENLTFSVNEGEVMGLLGPNGAGKTTTIRMIMDIIEPDRGSISFGGNGFGTNSKKIIGYLPEERGLYEDATTGDVLEYLMIASIYALLGASAEDVQAGSQSRGVFVIVPVIPIYFISAIINSPEALWVRLVSFFPPFTPTM
ncbi:ATP-binding cassette domain-containing protein, partial [Candidatus Bipolaricaulota bacterium]|nr:ATP-binding cassette domain-containing protein [Candidatus Bipolaricaulota bacterium]